MTNLYIVESPFQMISAIEAKEYFSDDGSFLIINYLSKRTCANSNDQLRTLKDYSHWDNVIEINSIVSTKESNIHLLLLLKKLVNQKYHFKRIFVGEYRRWSQRLFFDVLNPQECFILDDGNIVIELQNKYLPTGEHYTLSKGYKRKLEIVVQKAVTASIGLCLRNIRRDINVFTCFDLAPHNDSQIIIKNNFIFFKKLGGEKTILESTIYFFGGNFSELGLLDQKIELELLNKINIKYKKEQKKLVYIPHRRELHTKIEQIRNKLGIEILCFTKPAEMEFILMEHLPAGIASFCSTALYTVSRIYKFRSVEAFYIPIDKVPFKYQQDIVSVYNDYKKRMNVINLNEAV